MQDQATHLEDLAALGAHRLRIHIGDLKDSVVKHVNALLDGAVLHEGCVDGHVDFVTVVGVVVKPHERHLQLAIRAPHVRSPLLVVVVHVGSTLDSHGNHGHSLTRWWRRPFAFRSQHRKVTSDLAFYVEGQPWCHEKALHPADLALLWFFNTVFQGILAHQEQCAWACHDAVLRLWALERRALLGRQHHSAPDWAHKVHKPKL
mmetsp:Transcript_62279/g.144920  ORF Transcript_62279/g.144920 Transcript_62279/m.144920 type:complete len:204 (-) Transcript_62279:800-1411(-)